MAKSDIIEILSSRENPHLFGHEKAEQRFLDDVNRGVLHHAYLMTGPKGIGKATLAYRFARYLLAQKSGVGDSGLGIGEPSLFAESGPRIKNQESGIKEARLCDDAFVPPIPNPQSPLYLPPDHPIFRRVAAGSHSDLLVLSPTIDAKKGTERAEITAEEARKVPEFMSLTPAEGDWRIVIVDAVDQLNMHAANALLKILEEPPEKAIIFLICHEPGGTLATIRSRCRHFRLSAPDVAAFERTLETVTPMIERADYSALYALSFGSPGYAITLASHKGLEWYEAWLRAMQPSAAEALKIQFAEKAAALKHRDAFDMILHCWRTALYRASVPNTEHFLIFHEEPVLLAAIRAQYPPAALDAWRSAASQLTSATETFHLEKKNTLRLLLDPTRLDTLAA